MENEKGIKILITKKRRNWIIVLAVLLALLVWTVWGNITIETHRVTVRSNDLPSNFAGYKIAQISDFHNTEFGENNSKLLAILRSEQPDMIAFTGDLVDSRKTDVAIALAFVKEALKVAPCYYVTGNHEARLGDIYVNLEMKMKEYGVTILRDETISIEKGDESIQLIGLDDPDFIEGGDAYGETMVNEKLLAIEQHQGYKILLSHRPEFFKTYVANDINLVLSGHTHGGQFRIPFIGGIVAPNQGFLPEYDAGVFVEGNTHMIVSRGVGNSIVPVRFNCRPEVVIVELYKTL